MKIRVYVADGSTAWDGAWPDNPALTCDTADFGGNIPRAGERFAMPDETHVRSHVLQVDWYPPNFIDVLAITDSSYKPAHTAGRDVPIRIERQRVSELLSALEDAADYRRDQGDCYECRTGIKIKCGDHSTDDAVASMYNMIHSELQNALNPPGQTS